MPRARALLTALKDALARAPDLRRVKANLAEAFESEFDVEFREGDLNLTEQARYETALARDRYARLGRSRLAPRRRLPLLEAARTRRQPARCALRRVRSTATRTIRQVCAFSAGPARQPARMLADLEAALRDMPLDRVLLRIESFFASREADLHGLTAPDFVSVVRPS